MASIEAIALAAEATLTNYSLDNRAVEAVGVTNSSKDCMRGDLFVAIKGLKLNGNDFVFDAARQGAIAVISEDQMPENFSLPWLQVKNARRALAQAAAIVYFHPSRELKLVGVTGTNGKTTTVYLIDSILKAAFGRSAMLTTIANRIAEIEQEATRTTGEASDTQKFLRKAVTAGCRAAAMEVSSHAIDLHRADLLEFDSVVFTNLTQDHLDYHKNMEDYFQVKRRLFDGSLSTEKAKAAINIDCSYGRRLTEVFDGEIFTYGLNREAKVYTTEHKLSLDGLFLKVGTPVGSFEAKSSLVGKPHVYNILAAAASALSLGIELEKIAAGIESLRAVPGRFERVPLEEEFTVVVDYAHTDDALKNVLETARQLVTGRIICLFGCGGDRDKSKRPLMGKAAAEGSDLVIITSDNPRSEDPEQIIDQAEVGVKLGNKNYYKIIDRREAIQFAIDQAKPGDLIVVAGKGHENYQILKNETLHFDDKEVVIEAVRARHLAARR